MTEFRYLEHTADVKFVAYGKDLAEAFANCAKALVDVMFDHRKISRKEQREVKIESGSIRSLLYDFLEEILFFLDAEGILLPWAEVKIEKKEGAGYILAGSLSGDRAENYETAGDVKAMTYSQMDIKETASGYELTVVLDI